MKSGHLNPASISWFPSRVRRCVVPFGGLDWLQGKERKVLYKAETVQEVHNKKAREKGRRASLGGVSWPPQKGLRKERDWNPCGEVDDHFFYQRGW